MDIKWKYMQIRNNYKEPANNIFIQTYANVANVVNTKIIHNNLFHLPDSVDKKKISSNC